MESGQVVFPLSVEEEGGVLEATFKWNPFMVLVRVLTNLLLIECLD